VTSSRGICRPSTAHISLRPLPAAPEGSAFGVALPTPHTFRPRGFSPPRRLAPLADLRACCIPLAVMGFSSLQPSGAHALCCQSSWCLPRSFPMSQFPTLRSFFPRDSAPCVTAACLPSCRCHSSLACPQRRVATATRFTSLNSPAVSLLCLPMRLPSTVLLTQACGHSPRSHVLSSPCHLSSHPPCGGCRFCRQKLSWESEDSHAETRSLAHSLQKKSAPRSEEQDSYESLIHRFARGHGLGQTTDSIPSSPWDTECVSGLLEVTAEADVSFTSHCCQ